MNKKMKTMNLFTSKDAKKKALIAILLIIVILIMFLLLVFPVLKYLLRPSQLKVFVLQFGMWAPLAFISLQMLQMLFLIIPGAPFLVAGGYVFGNIGIIYSLIGVMIGSVIVFELGRLFGRPFIESVIDKRALEKIDNQSTTLEKTLFVLFLIPPFPHDVFSFISGITNLTLKNFILVSFIGRLPLIIIYTVVGYQLTKLNLFYSLLLLIIIVVGSVLIFYNRDKIENNIHKYTKKIKK
jgi:uncharacterized membrane protein YdjX (TVP38/TMEM64 family)